MYRIILTHALTICKGDTEKSPFGEIPGPLIERLGKERT